MGDRANVRIKESGGQSVYLYTHWGGYELAETVQVVLKRKVRWDDEAYLARIVFDRMTEGSHGEETGYGISTSICDNEHPIVTLDCKVMEICLSNEDETEIAGTRMKFEQYIELPGLDLNEWYKRPFKRN